MEGQSKGDESSDKGCQCKNKCKDSVMTKSGLYKRAGKEPRQQWKCNRCNKVTIEGAKPVGRPPIGRYAMLPSQRQKKRYYRLSDDERKAANKKRNEVYRPARETREEE